MIVTLGLLAKSFIAALPRENNPFLTALITVCTNPDIGAYKNSDCSIIVTVSLEKICISRHALIAL